MNEMQSVLPGKSSRQQGGRVHPELEALLALQDKDVAVTQCDAQLLALTPEVQGLDDRLAVAQRALDQARAAIEAAQGRRGDLEGKIASYKTMQEQRRQKLEWVRGAKEASTLMAELDLARSVLAKEEAEFMRSGDAVGEAERKAAEAERALEQLREAQAAEREALAGRRFPWPLSCTSPRPSPRSWCNAASDRRRSPKRSSVPSSRVSPIRSAGPTWVSPWRS